MTHSFIQRSIPLLLALSLPLTLSGCGTGSASLFSVPTGEEAAAFYDDLNTCLGDLTQEVTQEEYDQLAKEFSPLWSLRTSRLEKGKAEMGFVETWLFKSFSLALDDLTVQYFGEVDYYYGDEPEYDLVDYPVLSDGSLGEPEFFDDWEDYSYDQQELTDLWQLAGEFLPDDALTVFDTYSIFTDGADGVVAYVYWDQDPEDPDSLVWGLALDPEDSGDTEYLEETLLHEYFHYLSLNESQVHASDDIQEDTYCEPDYDIYSLPDSYLNQFYQAFWSPLLLDEREANPDSLYFFLRHYNDFYDDYATTDPSEDIAECFSCYVLFDDSWYEDGDLDLWEEKIAWFDQFEELREFRQQVLNKLDAEGL
jgi:hypothetical protein